MCQDTTLRLHKEVHSSISPLSYYTYPSSVVPYIPLHVYEQMDRLSKLNRCSAGLQMHLVNERNVPLGKATPGKLLIFSYICGLKSKSVKLYDLPYVVFGSVDLRFDVLVVVNIKIAFF
jgi:hypothetical protein